jgi:hypothetical protein
MEESLLKTVVSLESRTKPDGVRRWLLLAWVPAAFQQAPEPRRLLAEENRRQPDPRPPRHPHPPPAWLGGPPGLGT